MRFLEGMSSGSNGLHLTPATPHIEEMEMPRLDFLIVGAGIAGLTCAYSLKQAGHNVRVVEAEKTLSKSYNGVRVPPNMSRVLEAWGLGPGLAEMSGGRCPMMQFHSASTGEVCGELIYHEEVMRVLDAELYLTRHADVLRMLYDLVVRTGITVDFGCRVVAVHPEGPSVTLADGRELHADLVIGADGDCSTVRPTLFNGRIEVERDGILTGYTFSISRDQVQDDNELLQLFEVPKWLFWIETDWVLVAHPVARSTELAVIIYKKELLADGKKGCSHLVPIERALPANDVQLEPRMQRLFKLVDSAVQMRHVIQEKLDTWYDDSGHVVLVGDAAHLMNPNNSDSAALAVEDAVVLGTLFARLKSRDHIIRYLAAYQEMRQQRCQDVAVWGAEKVEFCTLPPSQQREARDASMRKAMRRGKRDWTDSDEDYLLESWEELKDVFGYNAFEDAETWWVEWGVMLERMEKKGTVGHVRGVIGEVVVERGENHLLA